MAVQALIRRMNECLLPVACMVVGVKELPVREEGVWILCPAAEVDAIVQMARSSRRVARIPNKGECIARLDVIATVELSKAAEVSVIVPRPTRTHHPHHLSPQAVLSSGDHEAFRGAHYRMPARSEDVDAFVAAPFTASGTPGICQPGGAYPLYRDKQRGF